MSTEQSMCSDIFGYSFETADLLAYKNKIINEKQISLCPLKTL